MTRRKTPIPSPPATNIRFGTAFREMRTARAWGLTPTEWYGEPRWSRAIMTTVSELEGTIAYWIAEDRKDK